MASKYKYEFFISYSRADYLDEHNNVISNSPVAAIAKALDDNNISYWIDVDKENSANQYMAKIARAIKDSRCVLFVSSERTNGEDSYWPIKEVLLASESKKIIVPIRIDKSEYNDKIALALAGLDVLEYYKNSEKSIRQLVERSNGECDEDETVTSPPWYVTFTNVLKLTFFGLLICFLFVSTFGTVGFCDGYFSTHEDVEEAMDNAFRDSKIRALDNHTIQYSGETLKFIYDLDSSKLTTIREDGKSFMEQITLQSIITSASVSFAFERLIFRTKFAGSGKTKAFVLIGGSIGILCGYTLGKQVGEALALYKNEKAIEAYFQVDSNKRSFKEKVERIYSHR